MRKDSLVAGAVLVGLAALVWFKSQGDGPAPLPVDPTAGLKTWQVVKVTDGDTINVHRGGQELRIRFCGIDAPETKQALGPESTALLRQLIDSSDGQVQIAPVQTDRYGRMVAEVWSNEVGLLNAELVEQGMAFVYDRYVSGCPSREAIEASSDLAQRQKLGVWSVAAFQKPWDWRSARHP